LVILIAVVVTFSALTVTVSASSATATVTARSLNIRKGPGVTYSVVSSVPEGASVKVIDKTGSWVKITYSGITGYVSSNYLKLAASSSTSSTLRKGQESSEVKTLQTNLKTIGYFSGSATGYYGSVTEQAVKSFQKDNGLTADGVAGPITLEAIQSKLTKGVIKRGQNNQSVKILQINLKTLGYFNATATGLFGSITEEAVKVFQKDCGLTPDGIAGPVTLAKIDEKLSSKSSTVVSGKTNITLRMGSSGSDVIDLQNALKKLGYFNSTATGDFGSTTRAAVIAFQKDNNLVSDGIAGPKTLTLLYTGKPIALSSSAETTAAKAAIELADWWTVASKVFARGATATVTDVKTGKSFKVKRYGGTNHADVEPLTANDTAKMKSIYGGSWSWSRRAIVVEIDGRRLAASMNGMPHGGSSLSYNNFSGHFCIHFLNSRTHGTNRVDPDHQAAIQYAYKNG
ncbi:MAG TPA: peptidoglycan-binding protein, partial [Clostridia bacterium]|nr:peptidoglycan-binding protein [Clostridia bacterium]